MKNRFYLPLLTLVSALSLSLSAFALEGYTVKTGDSLWRIAATHSVSGISTSNMVKAIKGLNVGSYPGIVDNIVKVGQPLTLPTTAQEAKDAIQILAQKQTAHLTQPETTKVPESSEPANTAPAHQNPASVSGNAPTEQHAEKSEETPSSTPSHDNAPIHPSENISPQNKATVTNPTPEPATYYEKQDQNFKISIEKQEVKNEALEEKLDQQKEDGHVLWGVIILILIIIAFIWRKKKKSQKTDESADVAKQRFTGGSTSSTVEPNLDNTDHITPPLNVNEALVESMILLEEGDTQNAKVCLQKALDIYPDNVEVRIKLIEVYAVEHDEISFNSERDYLAAHVLPHDDARWDEIDQIYNSYFV